MESRPWLLQPAACTIMPSAKKHFLAMSEIKQVTLVQAKSKAPFSHLSDQLQVPGNICRLKSGKFDSGGQSCGFGARRSRVRSVLLFTSNGNLNK